MFIVRRKDKKGSGEEQAGENGRGVATPFLCRAETKQISQKLRLVKSQRAERSLPPVFHNEVRLVEAI